MGGRLRSESPADFVGMRSQAVMANVRLRLANG